MIAHLKIMAATLATINGDLHRPHAFAYERVGFMAAGLSWGAGGPILFVRDYRGVADEDYIRDPSVGAMMGPDAIRKAMQWAMDTNCALLHVHSHGGRGVPGFSGTDIRENAKFVPSFFNIGRQRPHGAVVLSSDAARGALWLGKTDAPIGIGRFSVVGAPLLTWSVDE